jgi:rhodanese-related sulfurtransferase
MTVCAASAAADPSFISVEKTQELMAREKGRENFVIIDLRTDGEYEQGHLEGARSMNYYATNFQRMVSTLDREATILLYCRKGIQSRLALRAFRKWGFSRLFALEGGIDAWVEAGLPLTGP